MNKKIDYYYFILEVHMLAGSDAIKNSYRRLCKEFHPDNGGDNEYLKKLTEVYEILIDDIKRKEYHEKWKKFYLPSEKSLNSNIERNLYEAAFRPVKKVMNEYMFLIKNKDFETAYSLLSEENRNKIFKKDFVQWQKLTGEIYLLIEYEIAIDNFGTDVTMKVKVTELNLLVNRVEEDIFSRKLIYEKNEWKILLYDIDVKNIIRKYKRIIAINKKNRKKIQKSFFALNEKFDSRFVSYDVFLNNCEYEFFRFERYRRIFSVMKIENLKIEDSLKNEIIMERILEKNSRKTDSYTRLNAEIYLVLLPETNYEKSLGVKNKIGILLEKSIISVCTINDKYQSVKEYLDSFLGNM